MRSQRILNDSDSQKIQWANPVETQGAFGNRNSTSFGTSKGENSPKFFKKAFKNTSIPKQRFTVRKDELTKFKHQNYVPLEIYNANSKKTDNSETFTQITIVSPYFESTPVSSLIKQKGQLLMSNFITVIQQVTNIMVFAQSKQIRHFHLNANSILFIKNENNSNKANSDYFVKICDWGFQNEMCSRKKFTKLIDFLKKISRSSMFEYLHPSLLFEVQNQELYHTYKSKYDIWAFGVILFKLAFFKHPFQQNGSFSPQKLQDYYMKKQNLHIEGQNLLTIIIQKMLSLSEFQNWYEIKAFLIVKAERVESDFLGIKQIFIKHMNVIGYMIEIYKLTAWSIDNSANCFWYENKGFMKSFLLNLLKLMLLLHKTKFIQRFGHRILYLSEQQKGQFLFMYGLIYGEWNRIGAKQSQKSTAAIFFENFQNFIDDLTPLQTRIDDFSSSKSNTEKSLIGVRVRQSWESMRVIKQFSSQMISCRNKIQNCNRKIFQCLFEITDKIQ